MVELGQADLILRMDLLTAHVQQLELANGILTLTNEEEIKLSHRECLDTIHMHAVKNKVVPARTAQFLLTAPMGDSHRWSEINSLIEPLNHVFDRTQLIISTNLSLKNKCTLPVYIINPSEDDVLIEKGMPLAHFYKVDKITSARKDSELFDSLSSAWMMFNTTRGESGDLPSKCTGREDLDCRKEKDSEPETARDNLVGGAMTRIPILHDGVPDHLQPVLLEAKVTGSELDDAVQLLNKYEHVFVGPGGRVGRTTACDGHRIITGDHQPIRQRLRRAHATRKQIIADYIQDLSAQGCIRPSKRDWATPVVIVTKKDGPPIFCLDYRKLNAITKRDAYPLPRIDDALEELAFKKYFCTFDLASGYFQLPMHPDDCHKTSFITQLGLFEWLVLPMGLSNSPATFQRCMAQVFRGLEPNHRVRSRFC